MPIESEKTNSPPFPVSIKVIINILKGEKKMSKKLVALLMTALMLLSLVACGGGSTPTPTPEPDGSPKGDRYGGHMVIVNNQDYASIDPQNTNGSMGPSIWMQHIYETPVARGADGRIFPLICDFTESEDGLTYTFTVREYYFHNGEKVTIEDVLASLERAALLRAGIDCAAL